MAEDFQKIREKDHSVLICIHNGNDDIQKITEASTLTNSEVNYAFRKLQKLGIIEVEKRKGYEERVINGKRQVFRAPKIARLTEKGEKYFDWTGREETLERYRDMDWRELAEKLHELETRVERVEEAFETFRRQVLRRLN